MAKPTVRLRLVQLAFVVGLVLLLARAAQVQLVQGAEHAATAASRRTTVRDLPAPRGTIYDRNGTALALTEQRFHVGVASNELRNPEADMQLLARQLRLGLRDVRSKLRERWAHFRGPYSSLDVQPLRQMRGVHLNEWEYERFHPHPDLARGLLGRRGVPGRPASGLERILDSLLTGTPGQAVVLKDPSGGDLESPSRLSAFPVPGHDVWLTIDADLQEIVERALADAVEQFDAGGGDVVVLDPGTGEILAAAWRGASTTSAFASTFEPGSTAKLFTASAVLAHGLARAGDSVWTERGRYDLNGRIIRDEHESGWLNLRGVFRYSSNIGIAKFSHLLTPELQFRMLRDFGVGTPTGVEFPLEAEGRLRLPHQWSGTSSVSLAMGYELAVTPLQLAQAYAVIANDGVLMQPTLVREVRAPDGRVVYRHRPRPVRRVLPGEVAATLRTLLRAVVYEGGTGETAALTSYEVAGKTGTARRAGPGGYSRTEHVANFASLFPANDPQLVMVVKLDDPRETYARLTAAPVTRRVLEELLAAPHGPLDRARLSRSQVSVTSAPPGDALPEPWVVPWPARQTTDSATPRAIPDVAGLTLRSAARALHAAGFQVRAEGWGIVAATDPAPGKQAAPGTVVTVRARPASRTR